MKFLALIAMLFVSAAANAQFSVQETDGRTRWRLFGKTWNSNFFSLASTETDRFEDGGRISTYNYVSFAAYTANSYRMAFRVPFQYNTAGTDRFNGEKVNEQELFLQDLIVSLQKYDLLFLPWDLGLYWEGRVYLPTSEHSKDTGLITRLRNQFVLSKVFSRWVEMEYDQKFSYYFQSRTAYANSFEDEDGFTVDTTSATKRMELEHWVQVWGKITPRTGIGWKIGAEDEYYNESAAENREKEPNRFWKTGPSIRFPLTNQINFILVYEDKVRRENAEELGKFYAENTQFTLLSFVAF